MEPATLRTANPADRIALRGVRVHADLVGMAQTTRVEQAFVNVEPRPIEAVYAFPLPDGAAVCGFDVVTGDRVLTGEIESADDAIAEYEDAIAAGDAAYLAEQDRPDVFTVRVGNLLPRQAATVRLTYVRPLEVVDRVIRLTFPTTLAPRYATATGTDPVDAAVDADALNPPHVLSVPYGLTFTADVNLGRRVAAITSPTHAITVDGSRVSLSAGVTEMDRELVLSIELAKDVGAAVQVESGKDNESYLAVTLVPEFEEVGGDPPAAEVVFVLDCSGSMVGESIAQATAALELCLRTLNVGDTFNIVKFGSTFEQMSRRPVPYDDDTLGRAVAYVRAAGDMGGTELYAPLEAVLVPPPVASRPRAVILLTDGQVTNEPAIIELARATAGRNRIFSFGIGPACSAYLVNGVADATGGAAEFVAAGERIESKVLRTFARLASPIATDVTIDWGDADVQTLATVPPVFDGDVLTVFGRCDGRTPERVTLRCRTAAGDRAFAAAVPSARVDGRTIATMWARQAIRSLENGSGPKQTDRLVALSKQFNLLTSVTCFVAVERRNGDFAAAGRPLRRRVPVQLARGWGGVAPAGAAPSRRSKTRGVTIDKSIDRTVDRLYDAVGPSLGRARVPAPTSAPKPAAPANRGLMAKLFAASTPAPAPPPAAAASMPDSLLGFGRVSGETSAGVAAGPIDDVAAVLRRQSAAGRFTWDAELASATGENWPAACDRLEAVLRPLVGTRADGPAIVSTATVLLLLAHQFADQRPLWERAADKAVRYLANALGKSPDEVRVLLAGVAA